MNLDFDATRERLAQQLDDGLFTPGAQVVVEIGGQRVLDLAAGSSGLGEPMTAEHVFRVYCTIKPVTALAIARMVDDGTIGLDEPLEPWLPDARGLAGGVTLRHLLTHTAGLHRPMAVEMELVPPARRRAVVTAATRPQGWRLGADAAYSEYVAWVLLGFLLERVSGAPLRDHLRAHVLDPLGLASTWVGMTDEQYQANLPRLGVNADMRDLASFPMLFERTQRVCTETNPAHGGYTNARDLAGFYGAVLDALDGRGPRELPGADTLRDFCSEARPSVHDLVLDRECAYGLGFMTNLQEHAFGDRCGPDSFGHSGNVGASFAFADPERALSVGVVFNGLVSHEAAFLRRRALVNALYDDLDAAGVASDADVAEDRAPSRGRFRLGRRART